MRKSIRIATVYSRDTHDGFKPFLMNETRWIRISEALARVGYQVDMVLNTRCGIVRKNQQLRFVPYSMVDWQRYDIIKTLFHIGFESLRDTGGDRHPFIISKLGSVVGRTQATEGVHFLGEERKKLYEIQKNINRKSRYITILTESSRQLWQRDMLDGHKTRRSKDLLLVPTGVDKRIPPPKVNPYRGFSEKIALYAGNLYGSTQKHINLLWQNRLNALGRLLKKKGIRLCVVGQGDVHHLDRRWVTYLGPVENDKIWDYQYFAAVGIALAQGEMQHNESSKIYYYLRTGLPVVSEAPVPNNTVIKEGHFGFISDYADNQMMVEMIEAAVKTRWPKSEAIRYILRNHTWDKRVEVYDRLIKREFN